MELTMYSNQSHHNQFLRAQKQVKRLKHFYRHVVLYIIMVIALLLVRYVLLPRMDWMLPDKGFQDWLYWNFVLFPVLWGVALAIHGLTVFRWGAVKKWEDRKIQELMDEEKNDQSQLWN